MSIEKLLQKPIDQDLENEDVVKRILVDGTKEELETLSLFHNLTPEQIKLFVYFAKLRNKTIKKIKKEENKRKQINPVATKEELNMGAYTESIEPQARQTVLNLRNKGYSTYESGFYGYNKQKIGFEKENLNNFCLPNEFVKELENEGINIEIKPDSISFTVNKPLELTEIQKIWEQVEYYIPDLKQKSAPCNLKSAVVFREKQNKFKE